MTNLLTIAARPDAPVACDLTSADDTLVQRLAEYRRLFEHALQDRESTATSTIFRFADRPGVSEWLLDLVRREAECCPFLSYTVDREGERIVWTVRGVGTTELAVLDEFLAGAIPSGETSETIARQLTERGGIPVIVER